MEAVKNDVGVWIQRIGGDPEHGNHVAIGVFSSFVLLANLVELQLPTYAEIPPDKSTADKDMRLLPTETT